MAPVLSPYYGGSGGVMFRDELGYGPITKIEIHHGTYIDSIQTTYGTTQQELHGGGGGGPDSFTLGTGERIIAVFGRCGRLLDSIGFVSLKPDLSLRSFGPVGGSGGNPFVIIGFVDGFFGRSKDLIDAIGVYLQPGVNIWLP